MSKLVFALMAAALFLSCNDDKRKKSYDGFVSIKREEALRMINAYPDSRVPHDYASIIKSLHIHSKQFAALAAGTDSIKFFTGADTVKYLPAIIIQTIKRNSPASYEYFMFSEIRGAICPPPNDCIIESE